MSDGTIARISDVQGVTRALSLLNNGGSSALDSRITTLVVFSESQQGHFTLHAGNFGAWEPGSRFEYDPEAIQTQVSLMQLGVSATVGDGEEGGEDPNAGRPMTAEEALAAYKQQYPKAKGMPDQAILDYIAAIKTMYNEKKSAGHLKVGKISTIQEACAKANLMSTNKQGQPAPFYQRGGRKNYRSRALESIFHWVTGLSPKKKHGNHTSATTARNPSTGGPCGTATAGAANSGYTVNASRAPPHTGASSAASGNAVPDSSSDKKRKLQVPGLVQPESDPNASGVLRHYKFISQIGVGAFAVVYQAVHLPTGTRVAVKAMQKLSSNLSRLKAEINVLKTIKHPNVTALSEVIETESHVYLVLEYMRGGELFDAIVSHGGYTEAQAVAVTRNILKALAYLHSKGVIHRDLKPENLLLSDSTNLVDVKLTDFGMATIVKDKCRLTFTKAGTLQYVAPEIICSDAGYSFAVDLWSLGIVVVCLLTGNAPFACRVPEEYRHAIESIATTNGSCLFGPQWRGISSAAQGFVHALLRVRPSDRPTAEQALQHPWLAPPSDTAVSTSFELDDDGMDGTAAPQRLMKRPLSTNMERSHTAQLRHYSNQRKRGRVRSALFLKQQLAERPESIELGMDGVPDFAGLDFNDLEADDAHDSFGHGLKLEFPVDSPKTPNSLGGGSLRGSLRDVPSESSGGGGGSNSTNGPSDRLSQASLFSMMSGFDDRGDMGSLSGFFD